MKESEIRRLISEGDQRSYNSRLERLRFLLSIERQKPFPISALVSEYYEEARLCWYFGAFISTIVMVQLSFEELFRAHYRAAKGVGGELNSGKKVDNASFFDLIEEAKNDKWISLDEANLLHNFRKNIRNPYVHVKDIQIANGEKADLRKPNFGTQYFKIKSLKIKDPEIKKLIRFDVEAEAKESIRLLVSSLPEISRRSGGI